MGKLLIKPIPVHSNRVRMSKKRISKLVSILRELQGDFFFGYNPGIYRYSQELIRALEIYLAERKGKNNK